MDHASAGDVLEMLDLILNRVGGSRSAQLPTPLQTISKCSNIYI
jgi:hypothetical protein